MSTGVLSFCLVRKEQPPPSIALIPDPVIHPEMDGRVQPNLRQPSIDVNNGLALAVTHKRADSSILGSPQQSGILRVHGPA